MEAFPPNSGAMHLRFENQGGPQPSVIDIHPDHVVAVASYEDPTTVYGGEVRTTVSIERCQRLVNALQRVISSLKTRKEVLNLRD